MTIAETTPAKSDIMGLVPWFGSKRSMARDIAIELGEHDGYFELFAGSCAVLLEKSKSLAETVNDYHGDLVNLARVLASDQWEWLYNKADRYLYCEPLFLDLRQRWISEPIPAWEGRATEAHTDRAFVYLARNGLGGTEVPDVARIRPDAPRYGGQPKAGTVQPAGEVWCLLSRGGTNDCSECRS